MSAKSSFRPELLSMDERIVPARELTAVGSADLSAITAMPSAPVALPPAAAALASTPLTPREMKSDTNTLPPGMDGQSGGGEGIPGSGPGGIEQWNREQQDIHDHLPADSGDNGKPANVTHPDPKPPTPKVPSVQSAAFADRTGTADDRVDVRRVGDSVFVTWNGVTTRTVMNSADRNIIVVDMKGGTNVLTVGPLGAKDRVQALNTTTNFGTDTIRIGEGSLAAVQGTVEVSNNSGPSRVELNDPAETRAANYGVTRDGVSVNGHTVLGYAAPDPSKGWSNGVQSITLTSGHATTGALTLSGLANETNINGLDAGVNFTQVNNGNSNHVAVQRMAGTLNVVGDHSADRITVGSAGSLALVGGTIATSNSSGSTTVAVDIRGTTATVTGDGVRVANGPTIQMTADYPTGGGIDLSGAGLASIRADGAGPRHTNGVATPIRIRGMYWFQSREATIIGPAAKDPNIVYVGSDFVH